LFASVEKEGFRTRCGFDLLRRFLLLDLLLLESGERQSHREASGPRRAILELDVAPVRLRGELAEVQTEPEVLALRALALTVWYFSKTFARRSSGIGVPVLATAISTPFSPRDAISAISPPSLA